jgi:type 1 glutamine amidotransferase
MSRAGGADLFGLFSGRHRDSGSSAWDVPAMRQGLSGDGGVFYTALGHEEAVCRDFRFPEASAQQCYDKTLIRPDPLR